MNRLELAWGSITVFVALVLAAVISLEIAVLVLLFSAVSWWVWNTPGNGLILFIVLAPLLPLLKFTQSGGAITLIKDVIILTLFVKLVLYPLLKQTLPYRRNHLIIPIVFLAAWTLLNLVRADSLILGILRARDISLYVLLYLSVLYLPLSAKYLRRLFSWVIVTGVLVLLLGVYQWFGAADSAILRFDPARQVWIPRISSTLAHPSVFGEYLITLGLALGAALIATSAARWRLAWLALLAVTLPFVFLTYSRGAWLGFVSALVTAVLVWWLARNKDLAQWATIRHWMLPTIGAIAIALVLMMFVTPVGTFVRASFDPTYASNAIRLDFAARLIAPLTPAGALVGSGLGDVVVQNFRTIDIATFDIASGAARSVQLAKDATLVDNQYLKTFVELGLAGLLIYLWIYATTIRAAWQLAKKGKSLALAIGVATVAFTVSFMVQALFIDVWDIFPTNALYWIFAALAVALHTPRLYKNI